MKDLKLLNDIMKSIAFASLLLFSIPGRSQENYLLVGTYDSPKSEGIYVYKFNSIDGIAKEVSHVKAKNPSYLTTSSDGRFVYAVLENADNGNGGEVAAYSFDPTTGMLRLLNKERSGGDHPCYIELDRSGKWAFVANYSSGTLAVLPVKANGEIGQASTVITYEGSGPDTLRQKSPHVHSAVISADNKWLLVSDLGTDRVMIYAFDESTGKLTPATKPFVTWTYSGPRHVAFHPGNRMVYMLGELGGVVVGYEYADGKMSPFQKVSLLEPGDKRYAGSADIKISSDGKFLYASNRAEVNTILTFRINKKNGELTKVGTHSTLGRSPRNFTFDPTEKFILVGNQNSDEIVVFKKNRKTGMLSDADRRIPVGRPVCLKWIAIK